MSRRFVAIMAPAAVALQRKLQARDIQQPKTPHEAWFSKHYRRKLLEAAAALQSPPEEVLEKPELAASIVKSLVKLIGASLRSVSESDSRCGHRPSASWSLGAFVPSRVRLLPLSGLRSCSERVLKLSSVAPELAVLADTSIPMPGMSEGHNLDYNLPAQQLSAPQVGDGSALTIAALEERIELLHTRTRPKKVTLLASNGARCTFLLKVRTPLASRGRPMATSAGHPWKSRPQAAVSAFVKVSKEQPSQRTSPGKEWHLGYPAVPLGPQ